MNEIGSLLVSEPASHFADLVDQPLIDIQVNMGNGAAVVELWKFGTRSGRLPGPRPRVLGSASGFEVFN